MKGKSTFRQRPQKVVGELASVFVEGEFAVFSEFTGEVGLLICLEEPDESLLGLLLVEEVDLLSENWFLDEEILD